MTGISIPKDRTQKQPIMAYCANPECAVDGKEFRFEVDHDRFCCPKCGADSPPVVGMLVLTHFVILDKTGPIRGMFGRRFRLACDDQRAYLATATNLEAASGTLEAVNCPGCLAKATQLAIGDEAHQLILHKDS